MKQIPLTQGQFALVDDEDFEELNQFSWNAHWSQDSRTFYAIRSVKIAPRKWGSVAMHRQLLGVTDPKIQVDHKNHNGLDNQRLNLRPCTPTQNQGNKRKRANCTSRFKGVVWFKKNKCWMVNVRFNGRRNYLGCFPPDQEHLAAMAYNKAALEAFGPFALLNELS